ncbi:MAG TPA: hypothetical protein VM711_05535 [Sphingomicrobium sp.]|nr:hypothetical protein [Sphingomicrobium sp.]
MFRLAVIALAVMFSASVGVAQNRVAIAAGRSFHGPGPGAGPAFRQTRIAGGFFHRGFGRFNSPYYGLGYWPYYWPYYDWPYYDSYDYGPENQPAEMRAAEPPPVAAPKSEPLPDPVLLEFEGGRWVRVKDFGESAEKAPAASPGQAAAAAEPMLPAVLIYRDGHREEVTNYAIIGQVLYTRADYWTSGAWTRTIQLADLDIAATLKANQERGVKFDLPSGPDEVMIRP